MNVGTNELPRCRPPPSRRYRVSRSYLHLNRGLTSPLATAMNFIPVSYFWSPLCDTRRAPACLLSLPPSLPSPLSLSLSLFLFCYQSSLGCRCSPPRGCIPNFSATPARRERRGQEKDDESSTAVPPFASLANFACFHLRPSTVAVALSGSLRRKQEFRKRPRGREIREGCASRHRGSFREKMQSVAIRLASLFRNITVKHRDRNLTGRTTKHGTRRSLHFQFLSSPDVSSSSSSCIRTVHDIVDRSSYVRWEILSKVSRAEFLLPGILPDARKVLSVRIPRKSSSVTSKSALFIFLFP